MGDTNTNNTNDGGGNGAAGGGGESTGTNATTAGTTGTAPSGGGGEKLIPQSQVNALIAQARREGRESAAQQQPSQTQQQQQTQQPKANAAPNGEAQPMTAEAVQQLMQRERAFTRATATAGLNEKQLARMEAAFNAERPSDVAAWSTTYLEDMGFAKPNTQQNPNGNTSQTTQQTQIATAPKVPGQVDPLSAGGLVDIWNLSGDQIDQLGPEGIRAEHEKILAHANKRSGAPPIPRVMQRK